MKKTVRNVAIAPLVLALSLWAYPAAAQLLAAGDATDKAPVARQLSESPNWGVQDSIIYAINPLEFIGFSSQDDDAKAHFGPSIYCSADCNVGTGINLPQGALVDSIQMDAYDADTNGQVQCSLNTCQLQQDFCFGDQVATGIGFSGGDILGTIILPSPVTVDNANNTYLVECIFSGSTVSTRLRGYRAFFKLQVSPAPGTASFGDVPTGHLFFQHIEALAASGITAGCGGGNYCPDDPVTRGQMAVFLAKALGLHWE